MQCIYIENHDIFPYWICTYITMLMVVMVVGGRGGMCSRDTCDSLHIKKTAKDHFMDKYLD